MTLERFTSRIMRAIRDMCLFLISGWQGVCKGNHVDILYEVSCRNLGGRWIVEEYYVVGPLSVSVVQEFVQYNPDSDQSMMRT